MNWHRFNHQIAIGQTMGVILMVMLLFVGCAEQTETAPPMDPVTPVDPVGVENDGHVELAFVCEPSATNSLARTRLNSDILQINGSYRPITNFRFISLIKDGEGVVQSIPYSEVDHREGPAIKEGERYFHFGYCNMESGVNACLVYAIAENEAKSTVIETKAYNGSIRPVIPGTVTSLSQISFSLDPILDATEAREEGGDTWEQEAWALADALTAIANAEKWKTSTNMILKNLFNNFTNHASNLPGSAASVKKWIAALKSAVDGYLEEPPSGLNELEMTILNAIKSKIDETSISVDNIYPRDINLPDGAAALRWTEVGEGESAVKKFVPRLQTTTLDDINSVSRFVYPPALYYFVDSSIRTSNISRKLSDYQGYDNWNAVLAACFPESNGTSVSALTQTVAIKDPMQYAVAQLSMQVKAKNPFEYKDVKGTDIDISKLTLTGVIVGGQRPVGYNFKPTTDSEADIKFVYDTQFDDACSPYVLETNPVDAKVVNTLVLQNCDNEDVNIILEFEYAGTEAFKCINGYVYPGTRFYLVGVVSTLPENQQTTDYLKRIFTQDYITSVVVTVSSLEKAYNVLPSILSKNLEVGVETTPKWLIATPSDPIRMD